MAQPVSMVTFVCLVSSVIILFETVIIAIYITGIVRIKSDEIITVCFYLNGLRK